MATLTLFLMAVCTFAARFYDKAPFLAVFSLFAILSTIYFACKWVKTIAWTPYEGGTTQYGVLGRLAWRMALRANLQAWICVVGAYMFLMAAIFTFCILTFGMI